MVYVHPNYLCSVLLLTPLGPVENSDRSQDESRGRACAWRGSVPCGSLGRRRCQGSQERGGTGRVQEVSHPGWCCARTYPLSHSIRHLFMFIAPRRPSISLIWRNTSPRLKPQNGTSMKALRFLKATGASWTCSRGCLSGRLAALARMEVCLGLF
jgi:hypothetical protein